MIHVDLLSAHTTDTKLGRTHECVFSDNGLQNPFNSADNGRHDDAIMKPKKRHVQLALSPSHSQPAQMSSYYCEKVLRKTAYLVVNLDVVRNVIH